ncbi:hypothetical protein EVAR_21646_1 [Eumeta japonica]|uniref:Uncharacterized protein n=1 Tax=Eumeta variegata TaxID=151549 RepID=A0A4C1VGP4_EUMVA|nr:hypothetical protein EVAR_21646_1 [Eumeta japonica]
MRSRFYANIISLNNGDLFKHLLLVSSPVGDAQPGCATAPPLSRARGRLRRGASLDAMDTRPIELDDRIGCDLFVERLKLNIKKNIEILERLDSRFPVSV